MGLKAKPDSRGLEPGMTRGKPGCSIIMVVPGREPGIDPAIQTRQEQIHRMLCHERFDPLGHFRVSVLIKSFLASRYKFVT